MPYVGGKVTSFFDEGAQTVTREATRRLTDRTGGKLKDMVTEHTPVKTGKLAKSWKQTPAVEQGDGYMTEVGTDVDYAPYVENGTGLYGPKHAKYLIKPRAPGGTLRFVVDGKVVFAKYVWHPGSPGAYMMAKSLNELDAVVETGLGTDLTLEEWVRDMEAEAEKQE